MEIHFIGHKTPAPGYLAQSCRPLSIHSGNINTGEPDGDPRWRIKFTSDEIAENSKLSKVVLLFSSSRVDCEILSCRRDGDKL